MNRCLLLGALALALGACDGLTAPDLNEAATDQAAARPVHAFTLVLGKTSLIGTGGSLGFDAVVSDNRCPADVDCVIAGEARTRFTFQTDDGTTYSVALAIPGGSPIQLHPDQVAPAVAGGYVFRLVRLQPYPGYAPDTGMPVTATLVAEPCRDRCFEIWPPDGE